MITIVLCLLLSLQALGGATKASAHKDYEGSYQRESEQRVETASLNCLAETIFYEAGNQPTEGKIAVAFVVLNRAHRGGKTICEVVHQTLNRQCQFRWYCNLPLRKRPKDRMQWGESRQLARSMLDHPENYEDPTFGAVAFRAATDSSRWFRLALIRTVTIGAHIFYREK
jgi:N-acetylmuramoyl-L-alanine amidase